LVPFNRTGLVLRQRAVFVRLFDVPPEFHSLVVRASMSRLRIALLAVAITVLASTRCHWGPSSISQGPDVEYAASAGMVENPQLVTVTDREFVWNQVVYTIDNYFSIEREERVRQVGDVLTEGRIDTFPMVGSTILEPWQNDSAPGYERLHATLQSIRRQATVHVMPTDGGYLIEVNVNKELEDVNQPEHATTGHSTAPFGGSLVRTGRWRQNPGSLPSATHTLGWIPLGRDIQLEQRILHELRARLSGPPQVAPMATRAFTEPPTEPLWPGLPHNAAVER
jgi:hypothetical protein